MNRFDAMDLDLDVMHDDVRVDEENLGFVEEEGEEEVFSKFSKFWRVWFRPSFKPKKKSEFSENFQKTCNPKNSPFLEFQRIFRKFSENRPGISENRQFSITSHERDDMR